MKEERLQYLGEAQQYKKLYEQEQLRSQDKENSGASNSKSGGGESSAEMKTLRETKIALENKLRKYAAHCQRLEKEKATVAHSFRGHDFGDASIAGMLEDDLAGAVSAVIEKVASLEEECDALEKSAKRSSNYLMEKDRLTEMNDTLERDVTEARGRVKELTAIEAELRSKLEEATEAIRTLRDEGVDLSRQAENSRKGAADLESEKGRQLKYLEQENLSLINELREVKAKLRAAELEVRVSGGGGDDTENLTEDLGTLLADNDKENLLNVQRPEKEEPLTNKTTSSALSKRKSNALASSVRKSAKKLRSSIKPSRSSMKPKRLGLGEASGAGGAGGEDSTGECNQQ